MGVKWCEHFAASVVMGADRKAFLGTSLCMEGN